MRVYMLKENGGAFSSWTICKPTPVIMYFYPFFFFLRIYLFLDRGEGWEKERERNIDVVASCMSPRGDLAFNPGMCPDWESTRRPFGLQAGTQSTESHRPRPFLLFLIRGLPGFALILR